MDSSSSSRSSSSSSRFPMCLLLRRSDSITGHRNVARVEARRHRHATYGWSSRKLTLPRVSVPGSTNNSVVARFYPFSKSHTILTCIALLSLQQRPNTIPDLFQVGISLSLSLSLSVYVYVYVYIYIYIYIYRYTHTHTHTHIYIYIYIYGSECGKRFRRSAFVADAGFAGVCGADGWKRGVYIYIYIYICVMYIIYIYIYLYLSIYLSLSLYIYIYICIHICYVYIYMYVCITCMYIYI